jgi:hypothetical protein
MDYDSHDAFMDLTQAKIIELLREVHQLAIKEVERLNLRVVDLENEQRRPAGNAIIERPPAQVAAQSEDRLMNDTQVAKYLNISVAGVRRWRTLQKGPKLLKIGNAVRYRPRDRRRGSSRALVLVTATVPGSGA